MCSLARLASFPSQIVPVHATRIGWIHEGEDISNEVLALDDYFREVSDRDDRDITHHRLLGFDNKSGRSRSIDAGYVVGSDEKGINDRITVGGWEVP